MFTFLFGMACGGAFGYVFANFKNEVGIFKKRIDKKIADVLKGD